MAGTPIYERVAATVVIPNDLHVWSEDDNLTIADATEANGSVDQSGGVSL